MSQRKPFPLNMLPVCHCSPLHHPPTRSPDGLGSFICYINIQNVYVSETCSSGFLTDVPDKGRAVPLRIRSRFWRVYSSSFQGNQPRADAEQRPLSGAPGTAALCSLKPSKTHKGAGKIRLTAKAVKDILTEIGLQSKGGKARSSVPTAPPGASAWSVCGVAPVASSVLDCREQHSSDRRLGPQGSWACRRHRCTWRSCPAGTF